MACGLGARRQSHCPENNLGPAGIEPAVVNKLNDAVNRVVTTPAVRAKLAEGGLTVVGGSPEQFGRFIGSEIAKWTRIAKDVGATAD